MLVLDLLLDLEEAIIKGKLSFNKQYMGNRARLSYVISCSIWTRRTSKHTVLTKKC